MTRIVKVSNRPKSIDTHTTPLENGGRLECVKCRVLYPVKDGIPVLLPDASAPAGAAASGCANDGEKA